jgi:hypothetical protein
VEVLSRSQSKPNAVTQGAVSINRLKGITAMLKLRPDGLSLIAVLYLLFAPGLRAQSLRDYCTKGSWSNCGVAVRQELDKNPADLKSIVEIADLWGTAYSAQYDSLRRRGKIETSTPDAQKIYDAVSAKLNPIDISKDRASDALLKRFLPRLAAIMEWAPATVVEPLKAFFDSSEIATDYDELRLMNDDIGKRLARLLEPYMVQDWKDRLKQAVQAAGPQLRRP